MEVVAPVTANVGSAMALFVPVQEFFTRLSAGTVMVRLVGSGFRRTVPVASGSVMVRAAVAVPVRLMLLVAAAPMFTPLKGSTAVPRECPPAAAGTTPVEVVI